MLTAGDTQRLEIPHEPGQWIEVRRLSWSRLDAARAAYLSKAVKKAKATGGLDANLRSLCAGCRQVKHDGACLPPEERADQSERSATYDYDDETLLQLAIAGWSYDKPVSAAAVADLSARTAGVVLAAVAALNALQPSVETIRRDGDRTSAEIARVARLGGGA